VFNTGAVEVKRARFVSGKRAEPLFLQPIALGGLAKIILFPKLSLTGYWLSERYFKPMRQLIMLVVAFALLLGCATQEPVPTSPDLATEAGKTCARTCQATYAQCNNACVQMTGAAITARQRMQCLNNCDRTMSNCSLTCQ
jgi:hypothetical protein